MRTLFIALLFSLLELVACGANTTLWFVVHNDSSCALTNCSIMCIYDGHDGSGSHVFGPTTVDIAPANAYGQVIFNGGGSPITATVIINNGYGMSGGAAQGQTQQIDCYVKGQGCCTNTGPGNGKLCVHHHFDATIRNDGDYPMNAHWDLDGQTIHTETIPPHDQRTFTYDYDGDHSASWGGSSGGGVHQNSDGSFSGQSGLGGTGGDFVPPGGGTNYTGGILDSGGQTNISIVFTNPANGSGLMTNGPINWNSTDTTVAHDATLRAGFNALVYHDGVIELELGQINDALRQNATNIGGGGMVQISNVNNVTITNNNTVSVSNVNNVTVTNVADNGVSNMLGQAWATNNLSVSYDTSGTNASAATSLANTALGDVPGSLDGLEAAIGEAGHAGGGSGALLQMTFFGQVINADPQFWIPQVCTFSVIGFSAAALYVFCRKSSELLGSVARSFASTQTGGVPDMEITVFGIGGNALGWVLTVVVAGAFIILWIVVWHFVIGRVTGRFSDLGSVSNPFGSMPAGGLYILNCFFPVDLILTLAWTYLGLRIGATKVILVASAAARFLMGK